MQNNPMHVSNFVNQKYSNVCGWEFYGNPQVESPRYRSCKMKILMTYLRIMKCAEILSTQLSKTLISTESGRSDRSVLGRAELGFALGENRCVVRVSEGAMSKLLQALQSDPQKLGKDVVQKN